MRFSPFSEWITALPVTSIDRPAERSPLRGCLTFKTVADVMPSGTREGRGECSGWEQRRTWHFAASSLEGFTPALSSRRAR